MAAPNPGEPEGSKKLRQPDGGAADAGDATASTSASATASRQSSSEPAADCPLSVTPTQRVYYFQPFKLQAIDYKAYDGLFDQGSGINQYPRPRSGHRIVCTESEIFCFGGFNPLLRGPDSNTMFKELWCFNTFTKKWRQVMGERDELPAEQASHAMCMHGDKVVIFGGTGFPFGHQLSNKVHIVNTSAQPRATIQLLDTTGDPPDPNYGQSILVHDNALYVVGGTNGFAYTFDVHRLDFATLQWQCLWHSAAVNDELGRYRHEIFTDGRLIYVLGGGTAFDTFELDTIHAFCLRENKWLELSTRADPSGTAAASRPKRRKCHSAISYRTEEGDMEVVLAGGSYEAENGKVWALSDLWRLNVRTLQWCKLRTMQFPRPLYFHDAAYSSNGLMYVFGGIERTRQATRDNTHRTNSLFRVWVRLPKLSEMCWEAMTALWPALAKEDGERLLGMGVPARFVRRLPQKVTAVDPTEEMFGEE